MNENQRYILIDRPYVNEEIKTYNLNDLYDLVMENIEIEKIGSDDPKRREKIRIAQGLIEPKKEIENLERWLRYYCYEPFAIETDVRCSVNDEGNIVIDQPNLSVVFTENDFKKITRFGNKLENLELIKNELKHADEGEINERLAPFDLCLADVFTSKELMDKLEEIVHEDRKIDIIENQALENLIFLLENWPEDQIYKSELTLTARTLIRKSTVTAKDSEELWIKSQESICEMVRSMMEPEDVELHDYGTRYDVPLLSNSPFSEPIKIDLKERTVEIVGE